MRNALIAGVIAVAAFVLFTSVAAARPAAHAATVATARTGLGVILVDGNGRSLYLFEKDTHGRSACSGLCATYWPPLLSSGKSNTTKGVKRSLVGAIRRADGTRQVTYAGHPLYLFSGDANRGETNGEGLNDFGATWSVLMPSGKKIARS